MSRIPNPSKYIQELEICNMNAQKIMNVFVDNQLKDELNKGPFIKANMVNLKKIMKAATTTYGDLTLRDRVYLPNARLNLENFSNNTSFFWQLTTMIDMCEQSKGFWKKGSTVQNQSNSSGNSKKGN